MTSSGRASRRPDAPRPAAGTRTLAPYALIAPFLVLFALCFLAPIGYAVWQSLQGVTRSGLLGPPHDTYVGLANYGDVVRDAAFWDGVGRVVRFGAVTLPLNIGLAVVFALLLDSTRVRFRRFYRTALFLPYAVPLVVATLMWSYFYQPEFSPITDAASTVGLGSPDFLGSSTILWSMSNIAVWQWTGYNMIILYSALQAIPPSIYEAARLDGYGEVSIALRLKLPLLVPALGVTFLFAMIATLQFFTEPAILRPLSTAVNADFSPTLYAYTSAVNANQDGYAAAISVLLAIMTFVLSLAVMRWTARRAGVVA